MTVPGIDHYSPEEIERLKVDHPLEVERVLRGVMEKKCLVTAYSRNSRDFLVTTLIGIDPEAKTIYFGAGPDAAVDQALSESDGVAFNTAHDQVRVLFNSPGLSITRLAGETVLQVEMPKEILRFQRREYYRMPTSVSHPVRCQIDLEGGSLDAVVQDISLGGVGVLTYSDDVRLKVGDVFRGCRLAIPDSGIFAVSLSVRTVETQVLKNGAKTHRAGCQFIDLSPSVETDIQRYIIRLERERRFGGL